MLIISTALFFVAYRFYLRSKYRHKRNLVLDGSYLRSLFIQANSIAKAVVGKNTEIPIAIVQFTQEDFQIRPFLALVENSFKNLQK